MERQEIKEIWEKFKDDIVYNNRYFSGEKLTEILKNITHKKVTDEKIVKDFYRARIGSFSKMEDNAMYAPPSKLTVSGRCNPVGIPYLYLANTKETAINETKPSIGEIITVAKFKVDVSNIFSFIENNNEFYFDNDLNQDAKYLIEFIAEDLRKVITKDNKLLYIPLQFVSEFIKNLGYDGFVYSSTVGEGDNLVMFNWQEKTEIIDKEEVIIETIQITSKKENNN